MFEYLQFRTAHHYLPSTFGLTNYVVMTPLIILGIILSYKKAKVLFYFFIVALFGCIVYVVGVELFHSDFIIKTQWF